MKKYYIRSRISDWKEVSEEKAKTYIKNFLHNCPAISTEEQRQKVIDKHYKEVDE